MWERPPAISVPSMSDVLFDADTVARYDVPGPRYTSYPTALRFSAAFGETEYRHCAYASNERARPLSLYVHIPFCATLCFYCGCNKIVTKRRERAVPYLHALHTEIARQGELFDRARLVEQLHFGGGTPTFIGHDEMASLMDALRRNFRLRDDDNGDYSIEIDPRTVDAERIAQLRALGFNRMSLGVQDFDPAVQRAVHRIQSHAETVDAIDAARAQGFHSINIDLIYGLPRQTTTSFARTLDRILAIRPDRLSVFNYAHLPERFPAQRRILVQDLPSPTQKLDILRETVQSLTAAGYVYIGMDHFALPGDTLAQAQAHGGLHRNFQGYTTHGNCDLVGLGISAIGSVGNCYAQNAAHLDAYLAAISGGQLPVARGLELSMDDSIRRDAIVRLICDFRLDVRAIERRYGIDFRRYFDAELRALAVFVNDRLVTLDENAIVVTPRGKFFVRNVCMAFDRYLNAGSQPQYSRAV